ncbi:hypothetical protein EV356DRAFT_514689 [Viridothelium virens]|uniref:Uncharacterized protein n=1 Tax=Viridothelium virens TaxID=1048519 RepID=A0A6A6HC61_VIRVR|nr:hypothetical protein EV356DRAFT_514689 [Viridothelium virens]
MEKGLDLGADNEPMRSSEPGVMKISSVLTSPSTDRKRRHVQASESSDLRCKVDAKSPARVDRGQPSKRRRSGEEPVKTGIEKTQATTHEDGSLDGSGDFSRIGELGRRRKGTSNLSDQDKPYAPVDSSGDRTLEKTKRGSDRAEQNNRPPGTWHQDDVEGSSKTSRKGKAISRYDQDLYTPVAGATRGLRYGDPRLLREIDIEIARNATPDDSSSDEGGPTMFGYYL